jgi:hypothetical protein
MARSLRFAIATAVLAGLVLGTGSAVAAKDGHDKADKILDTRLVGLAVPRTVIAGVTGAGHAWAIDEGRAKLFSDGRLQVKIEGLVLTPEGTNPVATGRAIVSCNGGATPADIVMSDVVSLSVPDGDARVDQHLSLPSTCLAPVIFFASATGAWFAVSG